MKNDKTNVHTCTNQLKGKTYYARISHVPLPEPVPNFPLRGHHHSTFYVFHFLKIILPHLYS